MKLPVTFEIEKPFEFSKQSEASRVYSRHVEALRLSQDMPPESSFPLTKDGLNLVLLREIAEAVYSKGKRCVVVVDSKDSYTVERLPDCSSSRVFYKFIGEETTDLAYNELLRVIDEYQSLDIEKVLCYDSAITFDMFQTGILSKTYLRRKTAGLAVFRKSKSAKLDFEKAIEKLISKSKIERVLSGNLFKILV